MHIFRMRPVQIVAIVAFVLTLSACGGGSSGGGDSSGSGSSGGGSSSSSSGGGDNYPPEIESLLLLPEEVFTDSTVEVQLEAADLEDDALTISYKWFVNGLVLTEETGPSLDGSHFAKGDTVSVTVSVSDTFDTVSESVETIVLDSPPVMDIGGVPDMAMYGELSSFRIPVVDPDGDSFSLQFLARPNGMSVDQNGNVTWTPTGPLFTVETDFHWKLAAITEDGNSTAGGLITVLDADREYPLSRNGGLVAEHGESLAAGDFDGDGKPELLLTDGVRSVYTLEKEGDAFIQNWNYPFVLSGNREYVSAIAAADINGDGVDEALVGLANQSFRGELAKLYVIGGDDRDVQQILEVNAGGVSAIRVGDTDNDGNDELILLVNGENQSASYLEVRNFDLSLVWRSGDLGRANSIALGEVISDGYLDLVVASGYVFGFNSAGYVNKWFLDGGFGDEVHTGDVDDDGVDEIVSARRIAGEGVAVFDANAKTRVANYDHSSRYFSLAVGDISREPADEIILIKHNSSASEDIHVFGFESGELLDLWQMNGGVYTNHVVKFLDLTGSNLLDLVWAGQGSRDYASLGIARKADDGPAEIVWQKRAPSQLDGEFIGGKAIRKNGQRRVLFASRASDSKVSGPVFLAVDPESEIVVADEDLLVNSHSFVFAPGDVNADGEDEYLLGAYPSHRSENDWRRHLAVYDSEAGTIDVVDSDMSDEAKAITASDLTGDLIPELIATFRDGAVRAYDIAQSTIFQISEGGQLGTFSDEGMDIEVVDLEGGERPDIVVASKKGLYVFSSEANQYVQRYENTSWLEGKGEDIVGIETADLDGDGTAEIVVASHSREYSTISVLDHTLEVISSLEVKDQLFTSVAVENYGQGRKNILAGLQLPGLNEDVTRFVLMDPFSLEVVMESPAVPGEVPLGSLHFIEVGESATPAISYGTSSVFGVTR